MQAVAQELPIVAQHDGNISHIAFSPDGQWMATSDVERFVRVWHSGKLIREYDLRDLSDRFRAMDTVRSIAISPQADRLTICSGETVYVFDLAKGDEIWGYDAPMTWGFLVTTPQCVVFSATGEMAVAQSNNKVMVWSRTNTGYSELTRWGDNDAPYAIRYLPDGKRIVGVDWFSVCTWDAHSGAKLSKYRTQRKVFAMDASPRSNIIAFRNLHDVEIWDIDAGERIGVSPAPIGLPTVAFSPVDDRIALGHETGVILIDYSGHQLDEYRGDSTKAVAFEPNGRRVLISGSEGKLRAWSV